MIIGESGQLIAHSLAMHLATDGGNGGRVEHLYQQQAPHVAYVQQREGRRALLPLVSLPDHEPDRN
jgi:hypothetical protein